MLVQLVQKARGVLIVGSHRTDPTAPGAPVADLLETAPTVLLRDCSETVTVRKTKRHNITSHWMS